MRRYNAFHFPQSIAKRLPLHDWMNLDQVIKDDRARLFVKEKHFFNEPVTFEGKLVEVIRPGLRRLVPQIAG